VDDFKFNILGYINDFFSRDS